MVTDRSLVTTQSCRDWSINFTVNVSNIQQLLATCQDILLYSKQLGWSGNTLGPPTCELEEVAGEKLKLVSRQTYFVPSPMGVTETSSNGAARHLKANNNNNNNKKINKNL